MFPTEPCAFQLCVSHNQHRVHHDGTDGTSISIPICVVYLSRLIMEGGGRHSLIGHNSAVASPCGPTQGQFSSVYMTYRCLCLSVG